MIRPDRKPARLVLEDGTVLRGRSFGAATETIGELVFNALRDLDKVAFVRFASVYREFQDVHDFVDELQPMLGTRRRARTR